MRIGLIGPTDSDQSALREAAEFLLGDAGVDQIVYLGTNADVIQTLVADWTRDLMHGNGSDDAFLERATEVALTGSADAIERLLSADSAVQRLSCLRCLPPAPARAIEMIDDRIVLLVHNKAVLDEDDIANAFLIVYGKANECGLRRVGPRYFFTPGPLRERKVAVVEHEDDAITIGVFDSTGTPVSRESLERRTSKLTVAQ